eukprot:5874392-Amphidinium_carterae.1
MPSFLRDLLPHLGWGTGSREMFICGIRAQGAHACSRASALVATPQYIGFSRQRINSDIFWLVTLHECCQSEAFG